MRFHVITPGVPARIVVHTDHGTEQGFRSDVVYQKRENKKGNVPEVSFRGRYRILFKDFNEHAFCQRDLFFAESDDNILVIEPSCANWMILDPDEYALLKLFKRPIPPVTVLNNPHIAPQETQDFILRCIAGNFLRVENYPAIFEPVRAFGLPYPDHFAVMLSGVKSSKNDSSDSMELVVIDKIVEDIFTSESEGDIHIEFFTCDIKKDIHLINYFFDRISAGFEKCFRNLKTILIHTEKFDFDESIIASINWNDFSFRFYPGSARELYDSIAGCGEKGAITGRIDSGLIDSIVIDILEPDDIIYLEKLIFNHGFERIRLNFPTKRLKMAESDIKHSDLASVMLKRISDLVNRLLCGHRENGDVFFPSLHPFNRVVHNLISNNRDFPCSLNLNGLPASRVFIDCEGRIFPCERYYLNRSRPSGEVLLSEKYANNETSESKCLCLKESCRLCQFRNFCPGICDQNIFKANGTLSNDGEDHADIFCVLMKKLVVSLMFRIGLGKSRVFVEY